MAGQRTFGMRTIRLGKSFEATRKYIGARPVMATRVAAAAPPFYTAAEPCRTTRKPGSGVDGVPAPAPAPYRLAV